MKKDQNLLNSLLLEVESCGGSYPVVITEYQYNGDCRYLVDLKGYNFEELYEHALLLVDLNLAIVRDFGKTFEGPAGVAIDRLTIAGHDYLKNYNRNILKKSWLFVRDNVPELIVRALLSEVVKKFTSWIFEVLGVFLTLPFPPLKMWLLSYFQHLLDLVQSK
ncbi:hypothetical protein [Synechococcus elongatus]|uniref:hypothetical protein n=1 Tax=Synechococcus elongatus TaxID=32046 RepID=UPI0030CC217A